MQEALADALVVFSLDVVAICVSYATYLSASRGVRPKRLLAIESAAHSSCCNVAVGPDDKIWVAGHKRVHVRDADGKWLFPVAEGEWYGDVTGIAFGAHGEVFVADAADHRIVVCGLDGNLVRTFGSSGREHEHLYWPMGVAASGSGLVLVAEVNNDRVQVFRRDGSVVSAFDTHSVRSASHARQAARLW